MINWKEVIRVGVILFLITAISALLLAFANKITAPLIEINNQKKTEESMRAVFADADAFEKHEYTDDNVSEVYIAKSNGENVGYCVVSAENGYGGKVKVMTGINSDGMVTGVDILSHSETPGLGANAEKPEFKDQFKDKESGIEVVKGTADGNKISAMSGATITSKAVTKAVNDALEVAEKIEEGE